MTINVCLVTGEYPPSHGGVADYTERLAYALIEAGASVEVLTHRRKRETVKRVRLDPVRVYRAIPRWDLWTPVRLHRASRMLDADIIHIQYQTAAFDMSPWVNMSPWWLSKRGVTTAITYHDLRPPYLFPKAGRVRDWITRLAGRSCDLVIATTDEDAASLSADSVQATVVPIGSNIACTLPDDFSPASWREQNGVPAGPAIGFFGLHNASKGVARLPELLAELVRRGNDAILVLIGSPTGASDRTNARTSEDLRRAIAADGLADRVIATGHLEQEDVAAWLRAVDAVVLPYEDGASFRRGTLMAALESGAAIVTTTPMGPEPRLVDGANARLVPVGDTDALVEAVEGLIRDHAAADRLRIGAIATAAEFTWPAIARRHIELYGELRPE